MNEYRTIDSVDREILTLLRSNARIPNAEIARQVGMAPSAVLERVRKLEEHGVITGYAAQINPTAVGYGLLAFIFVRTTTGSWQEDTGQQLASCPEVEEVHHVTGEDCFLVKVRVKDTDALGVLLRDRFNHAKSVGSTRTTIVLEVVKNASVPNMPIVDDVVEELTEVQPS